LFYPQTCPAHDFETDGKSFPKQWPKQKLLIINQYLNEKLPKDHPIGRKTPKTASTLSTPQLKARAQRENPTPA
jgi:hypothetical protein